MSTNPTPWAYEQACKALDKHRARADAAEALAVRLARHLMNPDGMPLTQWAVAGLALVRETQEAHPDDADWIDTPADVTSAEDTPTP